MVWKAPADEGEYYALSSPTDNLSAFSQLLVPFLGPGADPTFGREALPRSPDEERIRAEYKHRDAIVSMNDGAGNEWVAYQVWEGKEWVEDKGDLLIVHGLNDYGGKYSNHGRKFLDEGYRLIVPDLPAHGRSTGVHVYLPNLEHQADAMYLVIADVLKHDSESGIVLEQKRKIFIAGQSLGGFVAAYTCLKYGSPKDTDLRVAEGGFRPEITGGLFLCPMLAISPETRPHYMVELLARGIASFAGPLPLASANKGNNSDDPDVEIQFQADPQTYHGKLRVGTGLAILKGLTDLNALMSHLKVPFSIYHGTGDRVTSYHGSEKLYQEASSTDKKLNLYEGYQHILLRVGHDELDDLPRQNLFAEDLESAQAYAQAEQIQWAIALSDSRPGTPSGLPLRPAVPDSADEDSLVALRLALDSVQSTISLATVDSLSELLAKQVADETAACQLALQIAADERRSNIDLEFARALQRADDTGLDSDEIGARSGEGVLGVERVQAMMALNDRQRQHAEQEARNQAEQHRMQYDDDDDGDRVGMGGGNPAMDERNAWIERRAEAMRRLDWINNVRSSPHTFTAEFLQRQCGYCSDRFNTTHDLQQHLATTDLHRVFTCCHRFFRVGAHLDQHCDSRTPHQHDPFET